MRERERVGEKENGMRIKLQPEVFLQECGGGSSKRVEKYNGSERGREGEKNWAAKRGSGTGSRAG